MLRNKNFFKSKTFLLKLLFVVYLIFLTKIILFKYPLHMLNEAFKATNFEVIQQRIQTANLIPFITIQNYLRLFFDLKVAKINILANIFAFFPLGFLAPLTFEKFNKTVKILILALLISLFYETIQLFFGIGTFDIDDLILNIFGSILGFFIFRLCKFLFKFRPEN